MPGAGFSGISPFELSYYINKQEIASGNFFQGGEVGPKCEVVADYNECMWLFNITADPTESNNLIKVAHLQPLIRTLKQRIDDYKLSMVEPVNKNGIFRAEAIQDMLDHLPIRYINVYKYESFLFGGFLSPFEDLQLQDDTYGEWLAYASVIISLLTVILFFALVIFLPIRVLRRFLAK
mmetsp:Transcript_5996/g.7553  ORF Transcript_5996/g.7553 Transcript_5996/m.7553 type:complete len:179 (-) Transcript_5996:1140-1676(-)